MATANTTKKTTTKSPAKKPAGAKAPADRKAPATKAREVADITEARRDVVSLGIDFTPIRFDFGDGRVWAFHPDPEPAVFGGLTSALNEFSEAANELENGNLAAMDVEGLSAGLSAALGRALYDQDADADEWADRGYGLMTLQRAATKYLPMLTGFPTE